MEKLIATNEHLVVRQMSDYMMEKKRSVETLALSNYRGYCRGTQEFLPIYLAKKIAEANFFIEYANIIIFCQNILSTTYLYLCSFRPQNKLQSLPILGAVSGFPLRSI